MKISTFKSGIALVAMLAMGAMTASAAQITFVHDGVIYKSDKNKPNVTAQKAGTALTTNQTAPTEYAGDIVIPNKITWEGTEYSVISIAAVFKDSKITSITIGDDVTTIGRGGFSGCTELKSVKLPANLETFQANLFDGCTSLESISIPGKVKEISGSAFKGCTALSKFVIEDGATALDITAAAFPEGGLSAIKEVEIYRAIGDKFTDMDTKPFRNNKSLEKVTIGGSCKALQASYFESATALKTVVFANEFESMGTSLFAGSGLEEITLPESVTVVPASCFQGCKSLNKVTIGSAVTRIDDMAFYNSTLAEINFPATLKTIGQMAFSGANLSGALTLPEAVTSVGLQAFAKNAALTSVAIPAITSNIADGAFMGCTGLVSFAVADGNVNYAAGAEGKYLASADGETIIAYAPAAEGTDFTNTASALAPYALYKASKIATVSLPNCQNYGDYSLYGTAVSSIEIKGTAGRYVAANCPNLTALTLDCGEIPFGVCADDAALASVTLLRQPAVVKQDAFKGCTSLTDLYLGSILAILEADCFKDCGVKTLTVGAYYPAAMAEGVFTAESGITVTVPADLVDKYKSATGWSYLNIVGDANIAVGGENMGMPAGLYFAGDDGVLYCAYDKSNEIDPYDVGGVPHTFQLIQFKNRIYGASAGRKFVYSATGSVDGDGKLFYISKVGDETFQAVVLDNAGNNAYKDPFGLYIYGDTLYVNDRNVCIRKIAADAIALPQDYPSWMENNWMDYYGKIWTYGCIKAGFAITQSEDEKGEPEPLYWLGMKYNGTGIFRFKESNVGSSSSAVGPASAYASAMVQLNPIFTTFYVDEEHGHMYIYMEIAGTKEESICKAGLYRIDLSKFDENPDPADFSAFEAILVDGSPVKYEGSATNEHVGISQLSPDENNEYLYWCYRAPTEAEAAQRESLDYASMKDGHYWWADKYDASNPLHHSGIKRIKLGEAQPQVEMVVEGVTGYGCVPVNYVGSDKPTGVKNVIAPAVKAMSINRDLISLEEDATLYIYDMAGNMVAARALAAGQTMSIADFARGGYVVVAVAEGGQQVVKVVK